MKQFVPEDESDHLLRCLRVIEYRMKIDYNLIAIAVNGCERRLDAQPDRNSFRQQIWKITLDLPQKDGQTEVENR
jgi:hypothetical protein